MKRYQFQYANGITTDIDATSTEEAISNAKQVLRQFYKIRQNRANIAILCNNKHVYNVTIQEDGCMSIGSAKR